MATSPRVKVFEKAVDSMLRSPDPSAQRAADVWLRKLQNSNDAWNLSLEILAPECAASASAKTVAASLVSNKLRQNAPPISPVQAAFLVEKFIPLCRSSAMAAGFGANISGGSPNRDRSNKRESKKFVQSTCMCVVRAAILQHSKPNQPMAQFMHTGVEALCRRSDLFSKVDPIGVLLVLECAASELQRLTPPRAPSPVLSMGLGGMAGVVAALKYSFGMPAPAALQQVWPNPQTLNPGQVSELRVAGLNCLRAWALAGLELQAVYEMEPMAVRGLVSLLAQQALDSDSFKCVVVTITASLEHKSVSSRGSDDSHRFQGPPPAPQVDKGTLQRHAELLPPIVTGIKTALAHGRHSDSEIALALVHLAVAVANRTDVVLPLLCGAGGAFAAGTAAAQQLSQLLLSWLERAAQPTVAAGISEPLAVAEVILDSWLWEDAMKLPDTVTLSVPNTSGSAVPLSKMLWQKLVRSTLGLCKYPPGFRNWDDTPFRVDASGSGPWSLCPLLSFGHYCAAFLLLLSPWAVDASRRSYTRHP